jgi:hypothetical protein
MPVCDPREFQCRPGCNSDAQCPATAPKCNTATQECVQCAANADCAATPATGFCSGGGRCVQCLADANCPATAPVCRDGTCGPPKK